MFIFAPLASLGTFTSTGDLVLDVSADFNTPEEKHQVSTDGHSHKL